MQNQNQAVQVIKAVLEVIKATGAEGIPSGVLYASLMPYGCTYEQYSGILGVLKNSGLVLERGHVLRVT